MLGEKWSEAVKTARVEVVNADELAGQRWAVIGMATQVVAILTPDMDVLDLFDLNDALAQFGSALRSADLARVGIVA